MMGSNITHNKAKVDAAMPLHVGLVDESIQVCPEGSQNLLGIAVRATSCNEHR